MFAGAAALVFLLAIIFHGAKVNPDLWLNWQGLALIGLLLVAAHLVRCWWWPGRPVPPQPPA